MHIVLSCTGRDPQSPAESFCGDIALPKASLCVAPWGAKILDKAAGVLLYCQQLGYDHMIAKAILRPGQNGTQSSLVL